MPNSSGRLNAPHLAGLTPEFVAITAVSLLNSGMKNRPPVTAVLKSKLKFSEFIPHPLAEQC